MAKTPELKALVIAAADDVIAQAQAVKDALETDSPNDDALAVLKLYSDSAFTRMLVFLGQYEG